jgi:hypothetical protein
VVVLEAQAVPSAMLLPCVKLLPTGWKVGSISIHNGQASFTLDSDRAGPRAVRVVLEQFCTLPASVTRVPTDEAGTRRFEEIGPVRPGVGFTGTRYYLFEGGCLLYVFRFQSGERAEPLGEANSALTFISRGEIRTRVAQETGGRAQLDPPAGT